MPNKDHPKETRDWAEKIAEKVIEQHKNCFHPVCPIAREIAKAIRDVEEKRMKLDADIVQRYINDPYTSDTATEAENIRNKILSARLGD